MIHFHTDIIEHMTRKRKRFSREVSVNLDTVNIGIDAGLIIEEGILPRKAEPRPLNKWERKQVLKKMWS